MQCVQLVTGWPDLKRGVKLVQKKDIEPCSGDFYDKISNEKMVNIVRLISYSLTKDNLKIKKYKQIL